MAQQIDIVANLLMKVDGAEAGINKLKSSLSKLKLPDNIDKGLAKSFANLDGIFERYRNQLNKGFKTKGDVSAFAKTGKELEAELDRVSKHMTELTGKKIDFKVNSEPIKQLQKDLTNLIEQQQKLSNQVLNFKIEGSNGQSIQSLLEGIRKTAGDTKAGRAANSAIANLQMGDVASTKANIETIIASLGRLKQAKQDAEVVAGSGLNIAGAANAIKVQLDTAASGLQKVKTDADAAKASLEQMQGKQLADAGNQANKLAKDLLQVQSSMNQANKSAQDFASSAFNMVNQVDQLKSSTQYFFGLRNMINLLKQGFREALNTVKELDAAMTETAVVTKFDVGDMWEKLPEYTANANALGTTIQDMYKSATLYYQQGLNANQAMSIASETMKMARIGGLEAADATDMMTAALRGFNMELSSESAQRINDVYSNLAAKTASNTQELGEAMERTASIAHSAGMSFEGTSAFLAQMIETTREAPENLGTAMKTIIARFQELKKNPLEMQEVDGEEVSFNKVDTALQTIGVTLRDTNGQFRELDQVFLDIAQRWDGLTQTQQRYIATTAAGSRQQSRFIAMMNNYDRTMQLMDYANDSAGASNEQFEKTMESMESKLAKLKNAWDLFTMGLADNDMLKGAVDGLTAFINGITTLIDKLSLGSSKLKSALTIFTAFMGLRIAGRGINALLGGLGGMLDPNSTAKAGLKAGAVRTNDPSAIYSPIVKAIHQLQTAITQKPINNGQNTGPANFGTFKDSYNRLQSLIAQTGEKSTLSIGEAYSKINRLDDRQQASVLGQMPALTMALRKNGITFDSKAIKGPAETLVGDFTKQVNKELANKTINSQAVLKMFGSPQDFKQAMGAMGEEYAAAAEQFLYGGYDEASVAEKLKQQYLESGNDYTQEEAAEMAAKAAATTEKEAYANKRLADTFKTVIPEGAQLAQKLGNIGGKAMMAGQGIAQLGMQLSNAGFEVAGQMVTDLGYKISSLGMAISGLGPVFAEVKTLVAGKTFFGGLGALFNAHPVIMTATAIITAITAISGAIKAVEKQAKDAGEKVRKSFEENYTKADEKISALTEHKDRFEELSKGVDEFGHNIDLSAEEYDEYLSISKELKDLSPSLIAGYNAEGEAIIKKGKAIQEVIDKLEDAKQKELDTFTSNTSVDKLIGEYQTSDTYKNNHTDAASPISRGYSNFAQERVDIAKLNNTDQLVSSINQLTGWSLSSLNSLTVTQLDWLSNHYNEVIGLVEEQNGTLEEEVREGYVDAFTNAGSAIDEVMTEGQPIIDALQLWMGSEGLDATGLELGEEFSNSFNEGVEGILATGLSEGWQADEFKKNLREYSDEWKNLAGPTSEYTNILKDAQSVQNEYLDNIGSDSAIQDYNKNITDSCNKLIELANNTDTATAAGQAFQQQCIAQANALRTYATEGGKSLSEALNTAVDDISQAESALENFNEATKTDLSTAAEGMQSIYDKASETYKDSYGGEYAKHFEGSGDRTAWEAGRAILDEDVLESIPDGEALQKRLKEWEPALREGQEGWYEFKEKIVNDKEIQKNLKALEDAGVKLDESGFLSHIPEDQWSNVAKAIGISEEMLTSMLNKGRQFADINFANWGEVRHNLETSNSGIQGTIDTVDDQGRRKLFVKESTYEAALADANYKPEEYEAKKQEGRDKQNLEYLKEASEYETKELKNILQGEMGFKNLNDLISGLASTGDFSKDEIRDYAEGAGYKGMEHFDTLYDSIAEAIDNPELYKQTSVLEKISGQIALLNDENTSADTAAKDRDKWAAEFYGKVGEAGKRIVDSEADYFARGRNADDTSNLSVEQYEATKKSLEAQQAWAEQQANMAEARAANASTAEEAAKWQDVADQWRQDAENIGTYLTMGAEAFAKAQQENQLVQDATQKAVDLQEQGASNEEIKTAMVESAQKMADAQMKPEEIAAAINQSYGSDLNKGDITIDENGKVKLTIADDSDLQKQLDDLTANIKGNITDITFNGAALASGQNNPNSAFHRHGTMARGSRKGYTISGRPTLTGEEGEELVWEPKRNQAYMVGSNGPQFANISKDAVVWNAEQTKRIKKNSKVGSVGTGARGIYHLGTMANGRFGTMAGGSGMTIPGVLDINATANIQEVTPPAEEPTIPVKADLHIGDNSGGPLQKLFGGNKEEALVAGTVTVDNESALQKVDEIKSKVSETKNAIEVGATFKVRVKDDGLKSAAKRAATINKAAGDKNINVTANTSGLEGVQTLTSAVKDFSKLKDDSVKLKASVSGLSDISTAISYANSFYRLRDDKVTLTTVKETIDRATGVHNHGYASTPSFGSAAKGYGQLGPKGKGGLTLTGELGYEIAWIPSENRSMILGANGPQMLNLPGDAVVWTHEQSKKILKQQAIPAGSHAYTDIKYRNTRYDKKDSGTGGGGKKDTKKKSSGNNNSGTNNSNLDVIIEKAGKVSVWWENMARRIEATQRKVDKNQKKFETLLKTFGKTAQTATSVANNYKKSLKKSIILNQAEVKKANQELKSLDKKGKTSISYEVKKNGKKTTKKSSVNLGNYIKEYDGTYIIDQKALNKVANKNKSKAEAIKSAAEQKLNDKLGKKNKAEDEIAKAQEALDKIADDIYTTFYQWENSLNKVYFLSKRLSDLSNQMNVRESQSSLLSAKALAGFGGDISALSKVLTQEKDLMVEQVTANQQNLAASKKAYDDSLKLSTYVKRYQKAPDSKEAQADFKAAQWALKFLESGGKFDESKIAELESKGYTADTIERIKKVIEDIDQKRSDAMNAAAESNNAVAAIYSKITEYQDYISDFESELLSGLEEQTEKEINKLDKINSSLTKAYKELLDEVKRALDERRKKEDNAKTESDISKKQQRLALLQADTSGGHATEIAQLEKEISEAQQNYQRSLEDQLIEKLQNQGDKAEKQRQKQIDLLNIQKDIAKKTGSNLAEVQKWLNDWQQTGDKQAYENIRNTWLANHGYDEATDNEKRNLERQFDEAWMKYGAYSLKIPELQKEAEKLDENTAAIQNLTEAIIGSANPSYGWKAFKDAGGSAKQAKELGATAEKLKNAGYSEKSIFNAGYSKSELSKAGFNAASLTKAGITAKQLRSRGYGFKEVQKAGKYSGAEMAKAGYTAAEFKKAGYSAKQTAKFFKDAGFSAQQISDKIAKGYGKNALTTTNMVTGKSVQTQTGASAASILKIINKDKNDKATRSDLAGVTDEMDINGKKKGGKKTGTISKSGTQIAVNKGSTLYVQGWNGKSKGKQKTYTIDKLTVNLLKKHEKEAKDALIYAIQHKKPGSLINKKMKDLINQAGLKGKTYKLQNGITGSIGKDGKIYYNKGKEGVNIWDAAAGKTKLDKYTKKDKKRFQKLAKTDKIIGREYAQILKKRGVKYATGGLADYTGPAWLDGTPSKPELVLNAQDTKNFIALKDVLSKAIGSTGAVENTYGNATYEININVDHLNNDYDVDKVVERVKKKIVQDSSYRNVTQVRKFR